MIYPFITVFEQGLNVSTQAIPWALALRSASGSLAPLLGSLADRYGRKAGLIAGLVLFTIGTAFITVWPSFVAFVVMLLLTYTGGAIFIPSLQAYLGDAVPYRTRATVLGISEMGWSLSFIIGVPVVGWIIAKQDWHAPFPWLTAFGCLAIVILAIILPKDNLTENLKINILKSMGAVLSTRTAVAGIIISMAIAASNELVNVVFGLWLFEAFLLKISALALASVVIGVAELSAELTVSAIVDRLGKARSVGIGLALNTLAALLLPVIGINQMGALLGLFFLFLTFEFTIVSSIPLMTELLPGARATLVANFYTSLAIGRALGAFLAPILYQAKLRPESLPGLVPIVITAALFNLLALVLLRILKGR